jgi:hypothetical protein
MITADGSFEMTPGYRFANVALSSLIFLNIVSFSKLHSLLPGLISLLTYPRTFPGVSLLEDQTLAVSLFPPRKGQLLEQVLEPMTHLDRVQLARS